jgi:hypothetical protein
MTTKVCTGWEETNLGDIRIYVCTEVCLHVYQQAKMDVNTDVADVT